MTRHCWLAGLALAAILTSGPAAIAQPLIADLSSRFIAITTGFTGTRLVLFGAAEGPGDVVVVVQGEDHDVIVRGKNRVAGIWVNTDSVAFKGVPSYYAVFSSRPLAAIASPTALAFQHIGRDNLRLDTDGSYSAETSAGFRAALLEEEQRRKLYADETGSVTFPYGGRLFRADIDFPASVPTGKYRVEVFLFRDGAVAAGETISFDVSQVGIDAAINDFAQHWALAYGLLAVSAAGVAGWLASLPFRNA